MKHIMIIIILLSIINAKETYYYKQNQKIVLTPIPKTQNRELSKVIYYKTPNGYTVGVTKEIIIKIQNEDILKALVKKYSLLIKKRLTSSIYLIEIDNKNQTLEIVNKLYKEIGVLYAHPNFIKEMRSR